MPALLHGLENGFAGAGDAIDIELFTGSLRPEFIVRDVRYGFSMHTMRFADETSAEALRPGLLRDFRFRRDKFVDMLAGGEKIAVFQRPGQMLPSQALPILARLRAYGHGALLFVVEGHEHPPGTVEELGFGFFRGWTDKAAQYQDVGQCNLAAWISNCANARRLWDVQTAGYGHLPAH